MGRELSYLPIKNNEHLKAHCIYTKNDCEWEGFDKLTKEEVFLVKKYNFCEDAVEDGKNTVDGMERKFFTLEALDKLIREKLDVKDYKQAEFLCRIADDTTYGVVITSG